MLGVVLVAPLVVVVLICAVVFWRRSHDPMARLFTMTLLAPYTFGSRSLLTHESDSVLGHSVSVAFAVAILLPVMVANAISFASGWGIDRIISRTVSYALLSALSSPCASA